MTIIEIINMMKDVSLSQETHQKVIQVTELAKKLDSVFEKVDINDIYLQQELFKARCMGSGTLSHSTNKDDFDFWNLANQYLTKKIEHFEFPEWKDIVKINYILNPKNEGQQRTERVYIGQYEALPPALLEEALNFFKSEILQKSDMHPILLAARVRYWLVTLHPFPDANGRTSNLVCDWILSFYSYWPMTFSTKLDNHIGGWGSRKNFSNFDFAVFKTANSLINSFNIFTSYKREFDNKY